MNLLFLSVTSTILCVAVVFALKYLWILRWIGGHAYVLSKRKEHFSILEVLDLFKNVKPFPISCQKGWKIHSYAHGHRIWFTFLTFPHNLNAPSIKVYGVFDCVCSSSQALLQVLKDIGQTCDWKPGVVSSSYTHSQTSHEVPAKTRGIPSMPVQVDSVKEEKLTHTESKYILDYPDPWCSENVVATVSIEFKRFWHREDNGICWLLQMNEKLQTCEFYLIQPVAEVDQCLVSVVTWSRAKASMLVNNPSVLLSALQEYMALRRLQKTPLTTLTLPQDLTASNVESSDSSEGPDNAHQQDTRFISKVRNFILDRSKCPNGSGIGCGDKSSQHSRVVLKRYSSILKYGHEDDASQAAGNAGDNKGFTPLFNMDVQGDGASSIKDAGDGANEFETNTSNHEMVNNKCPGLKRSISDGMALRQSRKMNREMSQFEDNSLASLDEDSNTDDYEEENAAQEGVEEDAAAFNSSDPISPEDLRVAGFKTQNNQSAAEVLAEAMRASNIDLELSAEQQAESSGGWLFSSFEKNIVILKKMQKNGSTVQSYIGKGFVLAPPKTVWDAVRNPRTKFTYDDTIKKVDIVENIDKSLKIVYFYHESQQFLLKESCDMCVLHGERQDGEKLVLTYSSVEHDSCSTTQGVTRAKFLPSGWIIEPARQDNKVYSIVTYLMQIDFGGTPGSSRALPFQDMISRYPLGIADLQQYLKPAMQLLRRKSLN